MCMCKMSKFIFFLHSFGCKYIKKCQRLYTMTDDKFRICLGQTHYQIWQCDFMFILSNDFERNEANIWDLYKLKQDKFIL